MRKLHRVLLWSLHQLERGLMALAAATIVTLSVLGNQAFADDAICLNDATAFPGYGTASGVLAPTVDGIIPTDTGWTRANQYVFGNGTTTPDGVVQMIKNNASSGNGKSLYFSFQVGHDDHYNPADKIILLLGPDANDATKDLRIHIHPVNTSGNAGGYPYKISVWRDSTAWPNRVQNPNFNFTQQNPGWINARVVTVNGPNDPDFPNTKDNSYFVELEIPIVSSANNPNGIYLPNNNIKMHFNILRVYQIKVNNVTLTRVAGQLNWPSNAQLAGTPSNPTDQILFGQPLRANWGNAILNTPNANLYGCSGVQVDTVWLNNDPDNHGTLNVPPVNSTAVNTYHIRLKNTGATDASKVLATIGAQIFGIAGPNSFGLVPAAANPIGPSAVIQSNNTLTLPTATWNTTRQEYENLIGQSPYVCSFIQLDVDPSMAGKVQIANRYFYWNTHFASASTFDHRAVLTTAGFKETPSGMQQFDIKVFAKNVPPYESGIEAALNLKEGSKLRDQAYMQKSLRDRSILDELRQLGGAIELYRGGERLYEKTVCAYRHIDQFIRMDGAIMELTEKTPCYSYWLHHKGDLSGWTDRLEGEGLKQISSTDYTMNLRQGKSVELATHIETTERVANAPCKCGDPGCGGIKLGMNDANGKLGGTDLLLIGVAGVGCVVFIRRRRRDKDE